MRLVSWNCFRGECRQRAKRLDALCPDIAVIQECSPPTSGADTQCVWFGSLATQGVGVVTRGPWLVESASVEPSVPDSAYPVRVRGPMEFNMLAVWAQQRPTYVRAILEAINVYREFLRALPTVVIGDFNSHPRWDYKDPGMNHTALVRILRDDFGLVSAYHAMPDRLNEEPTLYWQWQERQPFHIDYCFIPEAWLSRLRKVEVGQYAPWASESDHRPLAVEIADAEPSDAADSR